MMFPSADLFQVVTFAADLRHGNPAFVLSEVGDAPDSVLASVCGLLNREVVAVVDRLTDEEPLLRFFTPEGAHPGPGHASLAAAHLVLRHIPRQTSGMDRRDAVKFRLPDGGSREARMLNGRTEVDFPVMAASRIDRASDIEAALGARPEEVWVAPFGYVGIFQDPGVVAAMRPNLGRVAAFDRTAVIATAPGDGVSDIVVRAFAPNVGLPEDPVCGTAHRIVVPYWAERLGKTRVHSRHLSPRGGDLWCELSDGRVTISGESILVVEGTIRLPSE
jgi:predicted PhzF superfamily epimerase YddE/YHI9